MGSFWNSEIGCVVWHFSHSSSVMTWVVCIQIIPKVGCVGIDS